MAVAGLVMAVMVSCGGDARDSVDDAVRGGQPSEGGRGVSEDGDSFSGELTDAGPAQRQVHLEAGEALRVYARPIDSGDEVYEYGTSLAIGYSTAIVETGFPGETIEAFSQFFSDYTFGNDSSGVPYDTSEYGIVVHRTSFYLTEGGSDRELGSGMTGAFLFGRGWYDAAATGSWVTFVAPASGTYYVLISGRGAFEVTLDRRPTEVGTPDPAEVFDSRTAELLETFPFASPETDPNWLDVIDDQLDFITSNDFVPADDLVQEGSSYAPETLRGWAEEQLASYR